MQKGLKCWHNLGIIFVDLSTAGYCSAKFVIVGFIIWLCSGISFGTCCLTLKEDIPCQLYKRRHILSKTNEREDKMSSNYYVR